MILSWVPPVGFTIFIYLTLSTVSQWWDILFSSYKPTTIKITSILIFALLLLSAFFYLCLKKQKPAAYIWLLGISGCYTVLFNSIDNIVERTHLMEYGILACLYYIPLKKIMEGVSAFYATWLVTFSVGVVDEWIQYYLPTRVGVLPDIYLNAISAALPLLFLMKATGIPASESFSSRSLRISGCLTIIFLLLTGAFVSIVTDPGYRHLHQEIGAFYSRFSLKDLRRKNAQECDKYAAMIKDLYPVKIHIYLKDQKAVDKYAMEILVHLFRRDEYERKGNLTVAYNENSILSVYFENVISKSGHAWTPEKEGFIFQQIKPLRNTWYESPVSKDEILVSFSRRTLWGVIAFLILGVGKFTFTGKSIRKNLHLAGQESKN